MRSYTKYFIIKVEYESGMYEEYVEYKPHFIAFRVEKLYEESIFRSASQIKKLTIEEKR
jgi:hypothetical protein